MKSLTRTSFAAFLIGLIIAGYLIGSSSSFANAADSIFGSSSKATQQAAQQATAFTRGSTDVYVYYCAPSGQYTRGDLDTEVANLNAYVTDFFIRESSGLATVNFKRGEIIVPEDVDLANTTLNSMSDAASVDRNINQCHDPVDYGHNALVLTDVRTIKVTGYAYRGDGFSLVATPNRHPGSYDFFLATVAHELGHAIFGLGHTREIGEPCTDKIIWSLMNGPNCVGNSQATLQSTEITCDQRQQLDWPCEAPPYTTQPEEQPSLTAGISGEQPARAPDFPTAAATESPDTCAHTSTTSYFDSSDSKKSTDISVHSSEARVTIVLGSSGTVVATTNCCGNSSSISIRSQGTTISSQQSTSCNSASSIVINGVTVRN